MLSLILLVFALVLLVVAAALNAHPWTNRIALSGLACWVLSELLTKVPVLTR